MVEAGAKCAAGWAGCGGRTLLDAAALGGNEEVISAVLHRGSWSDVNVLATSSKRSALYTAVVGGHEAAARKLILAGADVDYVDPGDGYPPLVAAVCSGSGVMVTHLLMAGASPSDYGEKDPPNYAHGASRRFPLLATAAFAGYDEIVSALLEKTTADMNVFVDGDTPLMLASRQGPLDTVMALLAAGADVGIRRESVDEGEASNALDIAVEYGRAEIVKVLLRHGADVNACGENDWTPLHHASASTDGSEEYAHIIDMLLNAGADIAAKTDTGSTPLNLALAREATDAALALIQRGASVHEQNSYGKTALHLAIEHNDGIETALALLQHGSGVDAADSDGNTALHVVCSSLPLDINDVVHLLLRWGASETAVNKTSQTPRQLLDTAVQDLEASNRSWDRQKAEEIQPASVLVRALLERAPADRAWRRRCLLVMLRARNEKKRIPLLPPHTKKEAPKNEEEQCDRALAEKEVGGGRGMEGSADDDTGGCGRDGETEGGGEPIGDGDVVPVVAVADALRGMVGVVIDFMPDAVFHRIVMYL